MLATFFLMHSYRGTLYRDQYTEIDQTGYETENLKIALDLTQLSNFCLLGPSVTL